MDNRNYVQLYKDEKYEMCLNVIKSLSSATEEYFMFSAKLEDDTTKECIYKNNYLVCLALTMDNKTLNSRESWGDIMHQFIQFHVAYKGLPVIPLSLRLNYVYNALWWYWTKPSFNSEDIYLQRLIEISSQALIVILNDFQETYLTHFREITLVDIVHLIKRTSNYILKLKCLESLQLVDIYILLLPIIMKKGKNELIDECLIFFENFVQKIEILKLHLANNELSSITDSALFKFGLENVNSTATASKYESSLVAILITGSLVNLNKEKYAIALSYLEKGDQIGKVVSYKYILKYLKAYCHLYLEQDNQAELLLANLTSEPMGAQRKSYYYQLLGSLYANRSQHKEAISYFEKAVETGFNVSAALLLAANEAEELSIPSARCVFLKHLVDVLKAGNEKKEMCVFQLRSFQERCLSALHPDPVVTLPEALYLLAREALISQHYISSSEHYAELITTLKKEVVTDVLDERPAPLPNTPIIYHEAALANFRSDNLMEAHSLCQSVISNHTPRSSIFHEFVGSKRKRQIELSDTEQGWEGVLSSMDEDVVALILASDVLVAQKEIKKAVDSLDRCYNVILEYKKYYIPEKRPRLEITEESSNPEWFCDCLLAKVLLRKAKVNEMSNLTDSVYHYYRRALQFSPGDEEVLLNYKLWSQENRGQELFDLPERKDVVPVEEIHSCALKYILRPNVQQSSDNVTFMEDYIIEDDIVDSLFDDY